MTCSSFVTKGNQSHLGAGVDIFTLAVELGAFDANFLLSIRLLILCLEIST
jgi:hypothetical protein